MILENESLNGAFTVGESDTTDQPRRKTNSETIYESIKNGHKTMSQIQNDTEINSIGNVHSNLKNLIKKNLIVKKQCECCKTTIIYELIKQT